MNKKKMDRQQIFILHNIQFILWAKLWSEEIELVSYFAPEASVSFSKDMKVAVF